MLEAIRYRRMVQPIRVRRCVCGWKSKIAGKATIACPSCGAEVKFEIVKPKK